jgi:Peptidase family M28
LRISCAIVFNAAMKTRDVVVAFLALLLASTRAGAFEPAEVAAAASVARDVRADARRLAADDLEGRGSGTEAGARAEEILIDRLEQIGPGLGAGVGRDAYRQDFDLVRTNLLAVVPGAEHAEEFVIVGAHYDHLALTGCTWLDDTICNGATDNAAGVAAVLAIGRALQALPTPPARSVVLALWDGEELGLLGSRHFVKNPLVPLEDVVAYVNFDIQGANLAPSARDTSFAIGTESGGALLSGMTEDAIAAVGLGTRRLSVNFGQARSDYQPFWANDVPVAFFTDATNACYHTSGDEASIVDLHKLSRQSEIGFRLVLALAESAARPTFQPLTQVDTFEDLAVLSGFLTGALADLDLVSPSYQDPLLALEEQARTEVEAGPGAFNQYDALGIAVGALEIATNGFPCDPLLLPEPDAGPVAAVAALVLALAAGRRRAR